MRSKFATGVKSTEKNAIFGKLIIINHNVYKCTQDQDHQHTTYYII